jgi:hypothetical protein
MSINFITDFQGRIYDLFMAEPKINSSIKQIYFGPKQDAMPPFVVINIVRIENISLHNLGLMAIDLQMLAYAKDHNHVDLINLSEAMMDSLQNMDSAAEGYYIQSMRLQDVCFDKAKDLMLNRVTINYKTIIKKSI